MAGRSARILASCQAAGARDFVIGDSNGRHRLRLAGRCGMGTDTYFAPADNHATIRLTATLRFEQWRRGATAARFGSLLMPTTFQRQRLVLLLAISDARAASASLRDIAYALVFPRHRTLSGAAWKGASERRHCLRLLAESRDLTKNGYRNLLTGRPHLSGGDNFATLHSVAP